MNRVFVAVVLRDLRLAWRRRIDASLPVAFFLVACGLFPIGVGPEAIGAEAGGAATPPIPRKRSGRLAGWPNLSSTPRSTVTLSPPSALPV